MVLDGLDGARVSSDSVPIFQCEIGEEFLEPLDKGSTIRTRVLGVDNDRVERRGGGSILFKQLTGVVGLVKIGVEGGRERFERRV